MHSGLVIFLLQNSPACKLAGGTDNGAQTTVPVFTYLLICEQTTVPVFTYLLICEGSGMPGPQAIADVFEAQFLHRQ